MKPVKRSVAVVVRRPGGEFLIVRRPADPEDPLAGVWGLPAVTLLDGEDERAAVVRAGRVKLGVELASGARIGERTADRGSHVLRLADYEATIAGGIPAVPQPDVSMTQYTACRFTADPADLAEAAERGSLCAQVFLEDNSKKRPSDPPRPKIVDQRAQPGVPNDPPSSGKVDNSKKRPGGPPAAMTVGRRAPSAVPSGPPCADQPDNSNKRLRHPSRAKIVDQRAQPGVPNDPPSSANVDNSKKRRAADKPAASRPTAGEAAAEGEQAAEGEIAAEGERAAGDHA